jgi:hypothetical protein
LQIMGVRWWRKKMWRKEQNGRKSLRRLKPTVGCNASKRRCLGQHAQNQTYITCGTVRKVMW